METGQLALKSLPAYIRYACSVVSFVKSQTPSYISRREEKKTQREKGDPSVFPGPSLGGMGQHWGSGVAEKQAGKTGWPTPALPGGCISQCRTERSGLSNYENF